MLSHLGCVIQIRDYKVLQKYSITYYISFDISFVINLKKLISMIENAIFIRNILFPHRNGGTINRTLISKETPEICSKSCYVKEICNLISKSVRIR